MSSGTSLELTGLQRERSEPVSKQSLHSNGSAAVRAIINFPATPRGVREVESESEFDEDEWLTGNGSNVLDRCGADPARLTIFPVREGIASYIHVRHQNGRVADVHLPRSVHSYSHAVYRTL